MRVNKRSKLSKLTQDFPIRIVVSKLTTLVVSLFTNYYRGRVNYKLSRFYV